MQCNNISQVAQIFIEKIFTDYLSYAFLTFAVKLNKQLYSLPIRLIPPIHSSADLPPIAFHKNSLTPRYDFLLRIELKNGVVGLLG